MSISRISAVSVGLALLVSGCSSIGDGNAPEKMVIVPGGTSILTVADINALFESPPEEAEVFTCIGGSLRLLVRFSDGDVGDFTFRANWESSQTAVVEVSNGELPLAGEEDSVDPARLVFSNGGLKPAQAAGGMESTITATYLGMTDTIRVKIRDIAKDAQGNPLATELLPRLTPDRAFMAPGSFAEFRALTTLDGVETDITSAVRFGLEEENDEVAVLSTGAGGIALISAEEPGDPLKVQARFSSACGLVPEAPIYVAPLQSLVADYEEGFGPDLTAGTSQFLRVTGNFGDLDGDTVNDTQDLTLQGVLTSSDTAIVSLGNVITSRNLILAGTSGTAPTLVGTANITVTYGAVTDTDGEGPIEADPGIAAAPLPVTVRNVLFDDLQIEAVDGQTIEPRGRTDFIARGTYTFEGVVRTQDMSRHVSWVSSDTTKLIAGNGINADAGTVLSVSDEPGTVTLTATLVQGVLDSSATRPVDDPDDLVRTTTVNIVEAEEEPTP